VAEEIRTLISNKSAILLFYVHSQYNKGSNNVNISRIFTLWQIATVYLKHFFRVNVPLKRGKMNDYYKHYMHGDFFPVKFRKMFRLIGGFCQSLLAIAAYQISQNKIIFHGILSFAK
jgi:hypothetical protein